MMAIVGASHDPRAKTTGVSLRVRALHARADAIDDRC
jgi:hypothetical protein